MAKSRRNRSRRNSKSQRGGADESLRQGAEYLGNTTAMRGGALLTGAPVGYTGMLEDGLRAQARVGELDASINAARAQGPDQAGGRRTRRRNSRKSRKASKSRIARKSKKSRNAKKSRYARKSRNARRSRKQRGGAIKFEGADYNSSPMLLNDYSKAGLPSFKVL